MRHFYTVTLLLAFATLTAQGQSFESPFLDKTQADGKEFFYTEIYSYPGYEEKTSTYSIWKKISNSEYRENNYTWKNNQWEIDSNYTYINGQYARALIYLENGNIGAHVIEKTTLSSVLSIGSQYSHTQESLHYIAGTDILVATARNTHDLDVQAVDIVNLSFGSFPAYRILFHHQYSTTFQPEYGGDQHEDEHIDMHWHVPGLGLVKYDGSDPENDLVLIYELTDINFDFEPEPLPILDSDNAVWNALGYTWAQGGGWEYSFEFGSVNAANMPWLYLHDHLAWVYITGDRHGLWMWDEARARWIWSSQSFWPWYYDNLTASWQYGL